VEFSSVEQQINTNTSLTTLIQLTQAADVTQASAVVGKQVMVQSTQVPLQDGSGTVVFTANTAGPATVTVQNANGGTLQQVTVNAAQGANSWTWNGTNSSGQTLPDGAYTVTVTERQLDEIMGFLKPAPGEPSMFEESFAERDRERRREKEKR
jgi:flagellar basal-body rod modification protein FlgD